MYTFSFEDLLNIIFDDEKEFDAFLEEKENALTTEEKLQFDALKTEDLINKYK